MKHLLTSFLVILSITLFAQTPTLFVQKDIKVNSIDYTVEITTKADNAGKVTFGINVYNAASAKDASNTQELDYLNMELLKSAIAIQIDRINPGTSALHSNTIYSQTLSLYMQLNAQREDIEDLAPECGKLLVSGKVKIKNLSDEDELTSKEDTINEIQRISLQIAETKAKLAAASIKRDKALKRHQADTTNTKKAINAEEYKQEYDDIERELAGLKEQKKSLENTQKSTTHKKSNRITTFDKKEVKDSLESRIKQYPNKTNEYTQKTKDVDNNIGTVNKVVIEFDEGYIEKIKVYVGFGDQEAVYRNFYPIPFSRKYDYTKMREKRLFSDTSRNTTDYILLGDVITYDYYLEVGRKDYAPTDKVVPIDVKGGNKAHTLHKEPNSEIFSGRIFTDLAGIETKNPNGLVQIEVDKKFKLALARYASGHGTFSASFFNYGVVNVGISKIEQKARYLATLQQNNIIGGELASIKYGSALDIFRYRNFCAGIKLNVAMFEMTNLFSKFHINAGFDYGLTPFSDTLFALNKNTGNIEKTAATDIIIGNNVSWMVDLLWEFKHDERWGLNAMASFRGIYLLNGNIKQIYDLQKFESTGKDYAFRSIITTGLEAYYKPDKSGRGQLYGRVLLNMNDFRPKDNFMQIQVGYKFFLMKQDKIKPKK